MKNKERKELILADLKEEKKKIKECNYEKPNKKNLAYEEEYKKVDEALGKSILMGSGDIVFSPDPSDLANVLGTNTKTAKNIIITKIPDSSKKNYTDKEGNEKIGICLPKIQELTGEFQSATKEIKMTEICAYTNKSIANILDSSDVKNQRELGRDNVKCLDNINKEEVRKEAKSDAITGRELDKEFDIHHLTPQSTETDINIITDKKNYIPVNKDTHSLGHSSKILDDPDLTFEEKKEKLNTIIKEKKE